MYRTLEIFLLRSISRSARPVKLRSKCSPNIFNRVNLAVVESFRMMPSAMLFSARKSRLGFLHPVKFPRGNPYLTGQVSFISIDCFDRRFCMFAEDGAVIQVVGVVDRSRGQDGGQDEAMVGVHGCLPR